jgi:hypothetical protein
MAGLCLLHNILPVLAEPVNCFIKLFVERQRSQYSPNFRILLLADRLPEIVAEGDDIKISIRQCLI